MPKTKTSKLSLSEALQSWADELNEWYNDNVTSREIKAAFAQLVAEAGTLLIKDWFQDGNWDGSWYDGLTSDSRERLYDMVLSVRSNKGRYNPDDLLFIIKTAKQSLDVAERTSLKKKIARFIV